MSKNLAIVQGRLRDDVEKKMWMNNIDKRRITTNLRSTSQKPPGGSSKQVPSLGAFNFWLYKNYPNSSKFIDNKWCFNNKNVFTAIKIVYINGGSGQKTSK